VQTTWMKRCLGVASLTGGLLLAGAAVASADTGTTSDESASDSSLSAPIELGGVSLGLDRQTESSSSEASSSTDGDTTVTSERSEQDATDESYGIDVGSVTADPAGTLTSRESSRSATAGGSEGAATSSSESATEASGQAPVTAEGIRVTGVREESSATERSSSVTDSEGSTSQREATREESATGGTLGVGELSLNPAGELAREDSSSSATAGGRDGAARSQSASETDGALRLPVSFEGVDAAFVDDRASMTERESATSDARSSASSAERTEDASSTAFGVAGLGLASEPAARAGEQRSDSAASAGDAAARDSESARTVGLAAPTAVEGLTGAFVREDSSARETTSRVADENGTATRGESETSESRRALAGQTGDLTVNPFAVVTDERSSAAREAGDAASRSQDSTSTAAYELPFAASGPALVAELADATTADRWSMVSDREGTSATRSTEADRQVTRPGFALDGLSGAPGQELTRSDSSQGTTTR